MFSICGYNFCSDGNCLDAVPTSVENIVSTVVKNGIFDHFNLTKDVNSPYTPDIPDAWTYLTLMNANFNGNINAGNVDYALEALSGFKVKRRKMTDFEWVTLTFIPITNPDQLQFVFNDNIAASLEEYEYAFVPVVAGVEGNYITNTISTKFDGVFICDIDTIYKFYAGVQYGETQKVTKVGVFEPFGRKYPVVVSNGMLGYQTGSVTGTILNNDFVNTRQIDRLACVKERDELLDFLTNRKAKVLKDWNGKSWLMIVSGNPSVSYPDGYGMALGKATFNYTEVGDSNSQQDLFDTGMIEQEN